MSTYAATLQLKAPITWARTGGPKRAWMKMWDTGMYYVRRSNAWPRVLESNDHHS